MPFNAFISPTCVNCYRVNIKADEETNGEKKRERERERNSKRRSEKTEERTKVIIICHLQKQFISC